MARYIDVDLLQNEAFTVQTKEYGSLDVVALDVINEQPTVDVKEVVHGEWTENGNCTAKCSICGYLRLGNTTENIYKYKIANFCPDCGADMRKEAD